MTQQLKILCYLITKDKLWVELKSTNPFKMLLFVLTLLKINIQSPFLEKEIYGLLILILLMLESYKYQDLKKNNKSCKQRSSKISLYLKLQEEDFFLQPMYSNLIVFNFSVLMTIFLKLTLPTIFGQFRHQDLY